MSALIQETIPQLLYLLFCLMAVVSALAVVTLKNPVSAAFSLILVLLNVAGIFALQEAFFIAAVQVLVYAGAIMVLFVFVIMLLSIERVELDLPEGRLFRAVPVLFGFLFFVAMGLVLTRGSGAPARGPFTPEAVAEAGGNVRLVSELMFSEYVLPFLVMGMLLSVAIVGAVVLAKRKVE